MEGGIYCPLIANELRRGADCADVHVKFRRHFAEFLRLRAAVINDGLAIAFSDAASWARLRELSWMSPTRFGVYVADESRDPKKVEYELLTAQVHVDVYGKMPDPRECDVWELDGMGLTSSHFEDDLYLVRHGVKLERLRRVFSLRAPRLRSFLKERGMNIEVSPLEQSVSSEIIKKAV